MLKYKNKKSGPNANKSFNILSTHLLLWASFQWECKVAKVLWISIWFLKYERKTIGDVYKRVLFCQMRWNIIWSAWCLARFSQGKTLFIYTHSIIWWDFMRKCFYCAKMFAVTQKIHRDQRAIGHWLARQRNIFLLP